MAELSSSKALKDSHERTERRWHGDMAYVFSCGAALMTVGPPGGLPLVWR